MEAAFEANNADFGFAAQVQTVGASELEGALGRFRASGEKENFVQALGRDPGETGDEFGALAARETIIVQQATLPDSLVATAWVEDGTIMGLRHAFLPIYGVQFHPESIATSHGHDILRNFLNLAREKVPA